MSFPRSPSFQRALCSIVKCLSTETNLDYYEKLSRRTFSSARASQTTAPSSAVTSYGNNFSRVLCRKHTTNTNGKQRDGHILSLYKGRWMVPFYVLVRLKVLQLTGFAAFVVPVNAWLSQGSVDFKLLASSVFVMIGSAVASTSLWYYSKRYVGELALKGVRQDVVRFSVMDFWGNRTEEEYSLDSVIPPLRRLTAEEQSQWIKKRFFVPIDVIGGRQYFISVKHGHIADKKMLLRLLDGRHLRDHS